MATALMILCGPQFVGAQQARWIGDPTIKIDTVETTMAYEPEGVTLRGAELGLVRQVRIDDVPVRVVRNTGAMMVIEPDPQIPGFAKLELLSPRATVAAEIEFMPSLQASVSPDTMRLTLHGGEPGPYWLYYSLNLRSTPSVFPGIYHGEWLDMTSRTSGLLAKGFSCGAPLTLSYRIPAEFVLPVHFQALCLYNTSAEREWSFSNAFTLQPGHAWRRSEAPPPVPTSR
jgi:hypothetical protein